MNRRCRLGSNDSSLRWRCARRAAVECVKGNRPQKQPDRLTDNTSSSSRHRHRQTDRQTETQKPWTEVGGAIYCPWILRFLVGASLTPQNCSQTPTRKPVLMSMDSAFSSRGLAYTSDLVPKTPTRKRLTLFGGWPVLSPQAFSLQLLLVLALLALLALLAIFAFLLRENARPRATRDTRAGVTVRFALLGW